MVGAKLQITAIEIAPEENPPSAFHPSNNIVLAYKTADHKCD